MACGVEIIMPAGKYMNGAYNIMKKAFPNSVLVEGIEAFGLMPQILQQNIVDNSICNKMSTI